MSVNGGQARKGALEAGRRPTAEELGEKAVARFLAGFNCAESTLMTLAEALGRGDDAVPAVATGFGGGLGHTGSVCGCVTGSIMAIGLSAGHHRAEDKEGKDRAIERAATFLQAFEREIGEVHCRALTGYDLSDSAQFEEFRVKVKEAKCAGYMRTAVRLAAREMGIAE
ncbi:MAG: C-GCAxxG-C-C family protein [Bacillota bacterium]